MKKLAFLLMAVASVASAQFRESEDTGGPNYARFAARLEASNCEWVNDDVMQGMATVFKVGEKVYAVTSYGAILDDRDQEKGKFCHSLMIRSPEMGSWRYNARVVRADWARDLALLELVPHDEWEPSAMHPTQVEKLPTYQELFWPKDDGVSANFKLQGVMKPIDDTSNAEWRVHDFSWGFEVRRNPDRHFLATGGPLLELTSPHIRSGYPLMGAPAVLEDPSGRSPIQGIGSRELLKYQGNWSMRVRDWVTTPYFDAEFYPHAMLIPYWTVREWLDNNVGVQASPSEPFVRARDRLDRKPRVSLGGPNPATYELRCPKDNSTPKNPSPAPSSGTVGGTDHTGVGGTDHVGVGGTDHAGIGGSDLTGIGGTDPSGVGGTDPVGIGGAAGPHGCAAMVDLDSARAPGPVLRGYAPLMLAQTRLAAFPGKPRGVILFIARRNRITGNLDAEGFGTLDELFFKTLDPQATAILISGAAGSPVLSEILNRTELLLTHTPSRATVSLLYSILTVASVESSMTPEIARASDWTALLAADQAKLWSEIDTIEQGLSSPVSLREKVESFVKERGKK